MNARPTLRAPAHQKSAAGAQGGSVHFNEPSLPGATSYPAEPIAIPERAVVLRPMTGHSGAQIFLYVQGQKSFVRKSAGNPEQNGRLLQQSEKLRMLARYGVSVPRTLGEGVHETGCAYYDMEYVPARTAAAAICDSAAIRLPELLKALERMFTLFQLTEGAPIPAGAFHAKIAQIKAAGRSGICAPHGDAIAAMADRLDALCWDGIPASECHGDLTLENVLLAADGRVVLIDCDAGWLSAWWIDAAKLYQDVTGHWFLRGLYLQDERGLPLLSATQRLDRVRSSLGSLLAGLAPCLPKRISQLAALHLFRTLPYARDQRLVTFVLARMNSVLSASQS